MYGVRQGASLYCAVFLTMVPHILAHIEQRVNYSLHSKAILDLGISGIFTGIFERTGIFHSNLLDIEFDC